MTPLLVLLILLCVVVWSYDIPMDSKYLPRHTPTPYEVMLANLSDPDRDLECSVRQLAYQYAQQIQPFRGQQQATYDSLAIDTYCNTTNKDRKKQSKYKKNIYHINSPIIDRLEDFTVYVDPING